MKKLLITSLIILLIAIIVILLLPNWIINGSQQDFKLWFPKFGTLLYLYFSKFLYIQLLLSSLIPSFYFVKFIYRKFNDFQITHKIKKITQYAIKDILYNRKFTIHLFLRLLCLSYLVAFSSLLYQFPLISENGLIPYKEFASVTIQHDSFLSSFFTYPSLFWISQSNWFILVILWSAVIVSILGIFKIYKTFSFFWLWACYLSVVTFGRDLFQFPWDTFLLEIGILTAVASIYILKREYLPRMIWIAMLLLFGRQWLSMGMTKLVWSDSTWHDLTYMKYFWLNQPSPTPAAWFFYQLPMSVQKIITAITLIGELLIPIALVFGRRGRVIAFYISLLFSIMIGISGNFGFFNLITVVLGFWCLDDKFFRKTVETQSSERPVKNTFSVSSRLLNVFVYLIITFNLFYVVNLFVKQNYHANFFNYQLITENKYAKYNPAFYFFEAGNFFSHFRLVSPHGVFKSIPKARMRMEIHTKINGNWEQAQPKIGKDITDFAFVSPFMNRVPFLLFYHSYGIDFRKNFKREFSPISKLNPNTFYFEPWLEKLINGMFEHNKEIGQLIKFEMTEEIQEIKIIGRLLDIKTEQGSTSFNQNGKILVSKTFRANDKINVPIYTVDEISRFLE